ncbi:MAG: hypothetical protein MI923_00415 [Phycisphaerales bacterium]|nr:hypothetical protein [Phycisphaerales bacterium]
MSWHLLLLPAEGRRNEGWLLPSVFPRFNRAISIQDRVWDCNVERVPHCVGETPSEIPGRAARGFLGKESNRAAGCYFLGSVWWSCPSSILLRR